MLRVFICMGEILADVGFLNPFRKGGFYTISKSVQEMPICVGTAVSMDTKRFS